MPAIRDHDTVYTDDIDDDDGMPPLVDHPNPPMTFTFFTDMTPITAFTADPTLSYDSAFESTSLHVDFPESTEVNHAIQVTPRISHGKKRDASYIPRPPNAFILFRSSFIRSQQVPGKVEGNHSTLSKIIGKYWKTLPREEREYWEAKAVVAQAEHRKKYPDWRFRPGANALAKLKVKDGPGTNRRRSSQSHRKGRSEADVKEKREERCAKIADLLIEGKTGMDLEVAVKKWEHDVRHEVGIMGGDERHGLIVGLVGVDRDGDAVKMAFDGKLGSVDVGQDPDVPVETKRINATAVTNAKTNDETGHVRARCQTPGAMLDSRFKVPLTAMFRRSLSAPAARSRDSYSSLPLAQTQTFEEPIPNFIAEAASSPSTPVFFPAKRQHEEGQPRVVHAEDGCLFPLVLPSLLGESQWNDPCTRTYNTFNVDMNASVSSDCPGLAYELNSPSISPLESTFSAYNYPSPPLGHMVPKVVNDTMTVDDTKSYPMQSYSPYSSLKGWDTVSRDLSGPPSSGCLPPYPNSGGLHPINEGFSGPTIYEWSPFDDTIRTRDIHSLYHYSNSNGLEAYDMNGAMRMRPEYYGSHL